MNNHNPYWPVFLSIESEISTLMDNIHCTPDQFGVYSMKMAGMLLQTVAEIESIAKDLYTRQTGKPKDGIQFDHVALKKLNSLWELDKKVVVIATYKFYGKDEERILIPFEKLWTTGKKLWAWNDAYQNLKHNRIDNLHKGNIGNLLGASGALFLLNLYYDGNDVDLGNDSEGKSFRVDRGSNVFSIRTSRVSSHRDRRGRYYVVDDKSEYVKSTYVIAPTEETVDQQEMALAGMSEALSNEFRSRIIESIRTEPLGQASHESLSDERFGDILSAHEEKLRSPEAMKEMLLNSRGAMENYLQLFRNSEYRAIVNRHELKVA